MLRAIMVACMVVLLVQVAQAGLVGSLHDFSALGGAPCGYCHSVHNSLGGTGLLTPEFGTFPAITNVYSSVTRNIPINVNVVNTTDARICLACHDVTNVTTKAETQPDFAGIKSRLDARPGQTAYVNVDLSNDHPVGFVYDATKDIELKVPQKTHVTFGPERNQMWCSTCHNVHNNQYGFFLVMNNDGSALCFDCHRK